MLLTYTQMKRTYLLCRGSENACERLIHSLLNIKAVLDCER